MRALFFLFFFLMPAFWFPVFAYAACSSPAGSAGHVIYNKDYHVPTYCDGTNWKPMGPTGAGGTGCGNVSSTGLVGWWKLDETSGSNAADSSGNGYTATGSITWTTSGKVNGAGVLNTTGDNNSVASPTSLKVTSAFTFAAWVYPTSLVNPGESMIESMTDGGHWPYGLEFGNGTPDCYYEISSGVYNFVSAPSAATLNTWTHLACTFDGTTMKMYVNGAQVASQSAPGSVYYTGTPSFYLGMPRGIVDGSGASTTPASTTAP